MPNTWEALFQSCTADDLENALKSYNEESGFRFPEDHYNEIYPGVLLGDSVIALSKDELQRVGVTHVLNSAQAPSLSLVSPQQESAFCNWGVCGGFIRTSDAYYKDSGIKFMGIPATDTSEFQLFPYFYEAADFIESALTSKGKVLVHCLAGVSRSATIVAAYLMIKQNMTALEAVKFIRQRRPIRPNAGFLRQLCDLNELLRHTKAS